MNRPAAHNRLDPADIDALRSLFDGIAAALGRNEPTAPRALTITGQGGKTFCSGFTIDAISEQLDDRFERMLDALESLPMPTIAAINGGVYGGGTDLALCCDIRLGVSDTRMFMPAAKFAIHYYPGGLRRYVSNLGIAAAKKLFLTGMAIDASEMLRIGFLNELVAPENLSARIEEYVRGIGDTDAQVVANMKKHLRGIADGRPDFEAMAEAASQSVKSDESRRRLRALRQK